VQSTTNDEIIVGGYAVAFHGYPRFTKDIDVWIWANNENAGNLVKALHDFGFGSFSSGKRLWRGPDKPVGNSIRFIRRLL
jgi:phage replication-related protein YjqB (UPF0714/DUF867 family)